MYFFKSIASFVIFLVLTIGCTSRESADAIFFNGTIYTNDPGLPLVESVAVKDGRILDTGSNTDMLKYRSAQTTLTDLEGLTMTPGFIEGHGHFMGMGYNLISLDLSQTANFNEIVEAVRTAASKASPGEWISGRGWHQNKWDSVPEKMVNGFPVHDLISEVSPDNPVYLQHASGHALLTNQKAMEICGIDRGLNQVEGGEIIMDEEGNPTGLFNESAMGLIFSKVPQKSVVSNDKAFDQAMQHCLENGITSFHDAGAGSEVIQLYKDRLQKGDMKVRLYVMISGSESGLLEQYFRSGPEIGLGHDHLTIRSVKLYADGALGSRGAWLIDEYCDRKGHFGFAVSDMNEIERISDNALKSGFQVCTHAIGDRANREVLDIYEKVLSDNKDDSDRRFRIEHAQHLSLDDIPRFAELGIIPAMQAIHMSSDRPWAIDRLGKQRIEEGAYVWHDLLASGARIVNGTDVPVEPITPVNCFYASVARKTLKGFPDGGYEASQRMSREEALRSYTIDAAYGAFEEGIKGSIEKGKLADLTVFSQDIMSVSEEDILQTEVVMTIVGGDIIYNNSK